MYRKLLAIRAWLQWTAYRKWHMANWTVTWCPNPSCHMTLKGQGRDPRTFDAIPSFSAPNKRPFLHPCPVLPALVYYSSLSPFAPLLTLFLFPCPFPVLYLFPPYVLPNHFPLTCPFPPICPFLSSLPTMPLPFFTSYLVTGSDLDLSRLGDVINRVTIQVAICHFILMTHWNWPSISNHFQDIWPQNW